MTGVLCTVYGAQVLVKLGRHVKGNNGHTWK